MLLAGANGEMIPIYKNKKQKDILGPSTWYTDVMTPSHMRIRFNSSPDIAIEDIFICVTL